jgi:hypothetical protein
MSAMKPVPHPGVFGLTEFVEEFFLGLGGADLDQRPAFQDEVLNVGTNPPDRVGYQPDAAIRIEFFYRHHQPDVSLLNQVKQFDPVLTVFIGHLDDKTQVAGNQAVRGGDVPILAVAAGQVDFLLAAEQVKAVDLGHVVIEAVQS